jgi:hypothetical protein
VAIQIGASPADGRAASWDLCGYEPVTCNEHALWALRGGSELREVDFEGCGMMLAWV